nr:MAG TPA: hypothetical protein [Caudoviricetes sp.]
MCKEQKCETRLDFPVPLLPTIKYKYLYELLSFIFNHPFFSFIFI